jgi:hypothetical protein
MVLVKCSGWLDDNLAPYPGGLEERLTNKFLGYVGWNGLHGLWGRGDDDAPDGEEPHVVLCLLVSSKCILRIKRACVIEALVDHHKFAGGA